jgi:sulfatase modifying factor 1
MMNDAKAGACCGASRQTVDDATPVSDAAQVATPASHTSRLTSTASHAPAVAPKASQGSAERDATAGMVLVRGGTFLMGSDDPTFPGDGEAPVREVAVGDFWIDPHAVCNADFARFVEATGYRTEAERFGWSFVFYQFLPDGHPPMRSVPQAPWWLQVHGATWKQPEGPLSSLEGRLDHPVVHVSWNDAAEFANWVGKRLPSEAEWEYAARGGLEQKRYPWGDRLSPQGKHRCNIWQGTFPKKNTGKDGYLAIAPIDAFEPNGYGLYNMVGNVWEWCHDWWGTDHPAVGPGGPQSGEAKVTKGGSYLCHSSYCNRYRVAARTHNTPDSSTGHIGFRLVRDSA